MLCYSVSANSMMAAEPHAFNLISDAASEQPYLVSVKEIYEAITRYQFAAYLVIQRLLYLT